MGVSCLVSTGKHDVLDRFAFEIANIWLDVLGEIKEQENQREDERCVPLLSVCGSWSLDHPFSGLSLFWDKPFEELYGYVDETPEYERRKEVSFPAPHGDTCCRRCGRKRDSYQTLLDIQQRSRSHGQALNVHQGDVGQGSGSLWSSEF